MKVTQLERRLNKKWKATKKKKMEDDLKKVFKMKTTSKKIRNEDNLKKTNKDNLKKNKNEDDLKKNMK
jgi:hypothetical protein